MWLRNSLVLHTWSVLGLEIRGLLFLKIILNDQVHMPQLTTIGLPFCLISYAVFHCMTHQWTRKVRQDFDFYLLKMLAGLTLLTQITWTLGPYLHLFQMKIVLSRILTDGSRTAPIVCDDPIFRNVTRLCLPPRTLVLGTEISVLICVKYCYLKERLSYCTPQTFASSVWTNNEDFQWG